MTVIGIVLLFLFQALFLHISIYARIYENYQLFLQKGVKMEQIIAYNPAKHLLFSWLKLFFNSVLKFPVAVGIWIGLVSYYKRSDEQHWIWKLF